jgi:cytochrome c biogenesis protein CcmG/thiol:disulfide interchange protein DsbE
MTTGVADPSVRASGARIALGVAGAILATVLVLTGVLALLNTSSSQPRSSLIGSKLSAFTILPGVNGGAVRAPWLRHHPSVLLFFASWCTPCHAELPALARALGTGRLGNTIVVGIDGDKSPSAALSFVTSSGVRFEVAQDASQAVAATIVEAFPATVFVTSSGTIAAVHYGVISAAQLRAGAASLH